MCVYIVATNYILAWVWTRQGVTVIRQLDNTEITEYSVMQIHSWIHDQYKQMLIWKQ